MQRILFDGFELDGSVAILPGNIIIIIMLQLSDVTLSFKINVLCLTPII